MRFIFYVHDSGIFRAEKIPRQSLLRLPSEKSVSDALSASHLTLPCRNLSFSNTRQYLLTTPSPDRVKYSVIDMYG